MKFKNIILIFITMFALSFVFACGDEKEDDNKQEENNKQEEVKEYTVTFVVDGEKSEVKVKDGEKAVKPSDPEKKGYVFIGWYVGSEEYDFTAVTADVEVVAKFELSPINKFIESITAKDYVSYEAQSKTTLNSFVVIEETVTSKLVDGKYNIEYKVKSLASLDSEELYVEETKNYVVEDAEDPIKIDLKEEYLENYELIDGVLTCSIKDDNAKDVLLINDIANVVLTIKVVDGKVLNIDVCYLNLINNFYVEYSIVYTY